MAVWRVHVDGGHCIFQHDNMCGTQTRLRELCNSPSHKQQTRGAAQQSEHHSLQAPRKMHSATLSTHTETDPGARLSLLLPCSLLLPTQSLPLLPAAAAIAVAIVAGFLAAAAVAAAIAAAAVAACMAVAAVEAAGPRQTCCKLAIPGQGPCDGHVLVGVIRAEAGGCAPHIA